jgi:hypothetical protein
MGNLFTLCAGRTADDAVELHQERVKQERTENVESDEKPLMRANFIPINATEGVYEERGRKRFGM